MPFLHKSEHSKYDLTNHQLILAVSTDTFFFWWAPDPKETVIFLANIINQSFKPATIPFLFPGSRPSKLQMQSISRFIWLMSLCKDRHAAVLGSRLMYIKCFWPVATSTFCCMLWLEMFAVHNRNKSHDQDSHHWHHMQQPEVMLPTCQCTAKGITMTSSYWEGLCWGWSPARIHSQIKSIRTLSCLR